MKPYLTDAERHVSPSRLAKDYTIQVRFRLPVTKQAVYSRWFRTQHDADRYMADLPENATVIHGQE